MFDSSINNTNITKEESKKILSSFCLACYSMCYSMLAHELVIKLQTRSLNNSLLCNIV